MAKAPKADWWFAPITFFPGVIILNVSVAVLYALDQHDYKGANTFPETMGLVWGLIAGVGLLILGIAFLLISVFCVLSWIFD